MVTYDLRSKDNFYTSSQTQAKDQVIKTSSRSIVTEPVITFKIYDAVRIQDCITCNKLGPIIAVEDTTIGLTNYNAGDVVLAPISAASVSVENIEVKKVIIVSKKENPFKKGYWDIHLKYVFEFELTFTEVDGTFMGNVLANSVYDKKVTLFGSEGIDLSVSTDLLAFDSMHAGAAPFVLVQSKAVALSAEIKWYRDPATLNETEGGVIILTIGLFSIIKLFRMVDLAIETKEYYIPREDENNDLKPCDFFEGLNFPMDIFSPQQFKDYMSCNSGDLPPEAKRNRRIEETYISTRRSRNNNCGCDCENN